MSNTKPRTTAAKSAARSQAGKAEGSPLPPVGAPEATPEREAPATGKRLYEEDEVQRMIDEAVRRALAESAQGRTAGERDGMVTVAYIAEVSRENVLRLPEYGSMNPNSYLEVPKKEFGGKFMSPLVRKLLEKRHLLVTDGLTDEERERWGVKYREGEVLTQRAFDRMLDYSPEQLELMFPALCPEHQKFVCRRFLTAAEQGDARVTREKAKTLNDLSKAQFPDGLLRPVLEKFGEKEL